MHNQLTPDQRSYLKEFTEFLRKNFGIKKDEIASINIKNGNDNMLYIIMEDTKESREKLIKMMEKKNI